MSDIPPWVDQWDPGPNWCWNRRHEIYTFALKLLSYGPIEKQTGHATPRDIMDLSARMKERTWVIWRNKIDKAPPPPEKPPKQERKKTVVPTPKYPPLSSARVADLERLIENIYSCLPDADEKLKHLFSEFKIRQQLGKPTAAVERSMWTTIRSLGDEAERRYEAMTVSAKKRVMYRQYYPTIFDRLNAAMRDILREEYLRGA